MSHTFEVLFDLETICIIIIIHNINNISIVILIYGLGNCNKAQKCALIPLNAIYVRWLIPAVCPFSPLENKI